LLLQEKKLKLIHLYENNFMSYFDRSLSTNENIRYVSSLSWYTQLKSVFLAIFLFLVGICSPALTSSIDHTGYVGIFLILAFVFIILKSFLIINSTELVLTNLKVAMKKGILNIQVFEINLQKIESVQVQQTWVGRIFNFGMIELHGMGGSPIMINNVKDPTSFRRIILEEINQLNPYQGRMMENNSNINTINSIVSQK
jgi:hypothetical protein